MRIIRILNNSVVLVIDEKGNEKMVLGKGIGFQSKVDDSVDQTKIEKVFILESKTQKHNLEKVLQHTPEQYLNLTRKIVEFSEMELGVKFSDSIYIGLMDHITYALERISQSGSIKNAFLWEVKKFYSKEFRTAIKVLDIIEEEECVRFNEDEASFIAMHFVNGQQDGANIKSMMSETAVIQDILNIIKFHYKIEIDETSVNYNRFIVHIRYLLQRVPQMHHKENLESELLDQLCRKYPETYLCVQKISKYLVKSMSVQINDEEYLYLMLHIKRLSTRQDKKTNNDNCPI